VTIRGLGGFVFLLSHEIRLAFRGRKDKQRGARLALLAFLGLILFAVGWMAASLLSKFEPSLTTPVLLAATAGIAFVATLMLGHALIATTDAVYTRGDLDLLLSSPFSPWTVMTVRALGVAVQVATTYVVMTSGLLVSLAIMGAWKWLAMGPALVGLALLTTGGGLLIAMTLFATIGPRATRVAAQVIGAFVGASIFLAFQSQQLLPRSERSDAAREIIERIDRIDTPADSPLFYPARAFLGDTNALVGWSIASLLVFAVAAYWFSRRFTSDAAAILALGPKRRAFTVRTRPFRGGVMASLVRKEWRLIGRDPVLLSQILLQLIYMIPLVFVLYRSSSDAGEMHAGMFGVLAGAVAAISASLAASLIWLTVSAEDAPDLVAAAPIDRRMLEHGKLMAAVGPVVILAGIAAAGIARMDPTAALWTLAGATAAAISAGYVGVWHQEPGARKDFRRRPKASWTAQLGQSFVTIAWAGATGLAASGLAALAIIPGVIAIGLLLALGESRRKPA
jgi:ABC-2 type transport system permease protein